MAKSIPRGTPAAAVPPRRKCIPGVKGCRVEIHPLRLSAYMAPCPWPAQCAPLPRRKPTDEPDGKVSGRFARPCRLQPGTRRERIDTGTISLTKSEPLSNTCASACSFGGSLFIDAFRPAFRRTCGYGIAGGPSDRDHRQTAPAQLRSLSWTKDNARRGVGTAPASGRLRRLTCGCPTPQR